MCTCGNCNNCGCKCGCWGICSSGNCEASACCDCPTPTCGCGEDVLSGESCLNTHYYLIIPYGYDGINYTQYAYVSFGFGYCLATSSNVSASEAIKNYLFYYFSNQIMSIYGEYSQASNVCYVTTTKPTNSNWTSLGSGSAGNSFFWTYLCITAIGNYSNPDYQQPDGLIFTSYALANCSSHYPTGQYS